MNIVVIGGTGLIGSKLVALLTVHGQQAVGKVAVDELVRVALQARDDPRRVVTDPSAPYYGWVHLDERTLVPDDGARLGTTRFTEWLEQTAPVG